MSELLHDLEPGFDRQHSSPVVVTVEQKFAEPVGLTVTSLITVSADPPLVSFAVPVTSSRWPALERAEYIGLNQPAPGAALLEHFAARCSGRFGEYRRQLGPHSVPLLTDCPGSAVAHVQQRIHTGGHVIIVARLLQELGSADEDEPRPSNLRIACIDGRAT